MVLAFREFRLGHAQLDSQLGMGHFWVLLGFLPTQIPCYFVTFRGFYVSGA